MKNKIQLVILGVALILFLFIGVEMVLGAYTYDRTPSGTLIPSPVSLEITADDVLADLELDASTTHWGLLLNSMGGNSNYPDCDEQESEFSQCVPIETLSHTFVMSLCSGFLTDDIIAIGDVSEALCEGGDPTYEGITFETGNPSFEVYYGKFMTATFKSIASTTAYIGDLFSSFGGFIWLIIGVPLGFWIIIEVLVLTAPKGDKKLVKVMKESHRKATKRELKSWLKRERDDDKREFKRWDKKMRD